MILMKEPKQTPKILVWYTMDPVSYDNEGNVSEWSKAPLRLFDGTNMYTMLDEETQYTYNPILVEDTFNDLCARDSLYNSVGLLIRAIVGQDMPIFREDIDGKVILGVSSEFIDFGQEVYTQVMSQFGTYVSNNKLVIIWGEYQWDRE
jgi:hypothetical protein